MYTFYQTEHAFDFGWTSRLDLRNKKSLPVIYRRIKYK